MSTVLVYATYGVLLAVVAHVMLTFVSHERMLSLSSSATSEYVRRTSARNMCHHYGWKCKDHLILLFIP